MVLNPREMPKAIKASIREIPVTISALSMGIFVIPITIVRLTGFMLLMAMAAAVPIMQAARAEIRAIINVLYNAEIMLASENICRYQAVVKPPHWVLDFEVLKDRIIMVTIGTYKKIKTRTR